MGDPSRPADDIDGITTSLAELIHRSTARNSTQTLPPASAVAVAGHETVLVVEDNETILTLITNALSRLGYDVVSAGDGPTALERFGASPHNIAILVTDVMMPRMSGRELAIKLTAMRPAMKVLFASGYTQDVPSRHGAFEPDANFIQKPYTPHGLAARIRQLLDTPPA